MLLALVWFSCYVFVFWFGRLDLSLSFSGLVCSLGVGLVSVCVKWIFCLWLWLAVSLTVLPFAARFGLGVGA